MIQGAVARRITQTELEIEVYDISRFKKHTIVITFTGDRLTLDVDGDIGLSEYIYHRGDNDTYIRFAPDLVNIVAGGWSALRFDKSTSKIQLNMFGRLLMKTPQAEFKLTEKNCNWSLYSRLQS